jgi:hypothetical protein
MQATGRWGGEGLNGMGWSMGRRYPRSDGSKLGESRASAEMRNGETGPKAARAEEDVSDLRNRKPEWTEARSRFSRFANQPNRRIRTRTYGGVGGEEPRGSPHPDRSADGVVTVGGVRAKMGETCLADRVHDAGIAAQ